MLPRANTGAEAAVPAWRLPPQWRDAAVRVAGLWLVLIVLFAADWRDMALQWWNSSTYNHILLVPAIIGWLVWQRAPQLARMTPTLWWPGLVLAGGAMFVWVLGAFAGLNVARQMGAVVLLVAAALTMLGPRVGAALAFPLGYMLLLVPLGDELVPPLQMITAHITIALVRVSAIPAAIDGVFIDTPAGLFEVAEACSGVKFLVAMVAFGILVANVCFLGWRRRFLFLVTCIVVPVLANGVRAWGTIYAAQWLGADVAAGFDHIVYGWFFFAIVIAMILALWWRWFDRPIDAEAVDVDRLERAPGLARLSQLTIAPAAALALFGAVILAGNAWVRAAESREAQLPQVIDLPQVAGWHRVPYQPKVWWEPRAAAADHRLLGRYADARGRTVDVHFALYRRQDEEHDAGGFGEGALTPDSKWSWLSPGPALDGGKSDRLLAEGTVHRLAVTWYRSGPLTTGSNARLKLAAMRDKLLLRRRATMTLILSAEQSRVDDPAQTLTDFRRAMGPLDAWMDRAGGVR